VVGVGHVCACSVTHVVSAKIAAIIFLIRVLISVIINMIKHLVFLLLLTFSLSINAQVKIDIVGDSWEQVVHNAFTLIKETDSTTYKFVTSNCNHIGFWNGNYSTTEGKSIFLTTTEVRNGNINNIACAIVHESKHIELSNGNLSESEEECICYLYELEFLIKLKDVDLFLIDNIQSKLNYYNCEKYLK